MRWSTRQGIHRYTPNNNKRVNAPFPPPHTPHFPKTTQMDSPGTLCNRTAMQMLDDQELPEATLRGGLAATVVEGAGPKSCQKKPCVDTLRRDCPRGWGRGVRNRFHKKPCAHTLWRVPVRDIQVAGPLNADVCVCLGRWPLGSLSCLFFVLFPPKALDGNN